MAAPILCSIQGCNRDVCARGLCRSHYERQRKHGSPLGGKFVAECCSIDGCEGKHASKGLCAKHYARLIRHGDPLCKFKTTPPGEAAAWLREHAGFDKPECCLAWPFGRRRAGYGHMRAGGKCIGAHQQMCLLAHGVPPDGRQHVAHSCGNPWCVNPHHLRWASKSENEQDKLLHGTHNRGERHGMVKLTAPEVREIRALADSLSRREVAIMYGISPTNVWAIQTKRSWKWLE